MAFVLMGAMNNLSVEFKMFSFVKEGSLFVITECSRKVMNRVWLSLGSLKWLLRSLDNFSNLKELNSTLRDESRSS